MLSDITHLLHTFKFYLFFWCHGCRAPASHSCRRPWPHCAWCGSVLHSLVRCKSFIIPGIETGTVAILAQGTKWAVAAMQAFFGVRFDSCCWQIAKFVEGYGSRCRPFFCNQDPWSWIVAVLQDSMLSDITHLLHTFKFYLFFWCHGCRAPASHSCRRPWPHCAWCGSVLHSLVRCKSFIIPGIETGTVAILAQGTHWAVAATQAFFGVRFDTCC